MSFKKLSTPKYSFEELCRNNGFEYSESGFCEPLSLTDENGIVHELDGNFNFFEENDERKTLSLEIADISLKYTMNSESGTSTKGNSKDVVPVTMGRKFTDWTYTVRINRLKSNVARNSCDTVEFCNIV